MCLVRPVRSSRGASDWRSARIGAAPGVAGMRQPTYTRTTTSHNMQHVSCACAAHGTRMYMYCAAHTDSCLVFTCLSLEAAAARASTRRRRRYAVDAVSDSSLKLRRGPGTRCKSLT